MTATARPAGPTPDAENDPHRWRALGVCLAVGFMTLLDVSIVNVALPSIEGSLGAGPSQIQWIVAGYTLAFGLVLVPAGRIGDLFSRRAMFLIGLSGFILTSAVAGFVADAGQLAAVRLAQGVSAGLLNPQVLALIQQLFTGAERGRAFGAFGTTIGVSTAVGPLLGGAILAVFGEAEGWRGVFLVNVPIGLVLLPLAWKWLPAPPSRRGTRRWHLDGVGLVLLGATTIVAMLPFVLTTGQGGNPLRWLLLVPGLGLLFAFVGWERREGRLGRDPVVPAALVRTPSFSVGAAVGIAYFAGFTGIFLVVTLYLQSGLGFAPWQAGLVQTPFALMSAVSSQLGGRLVASRGRGVVVLGLTMVALGLAAADVVAATVGGTGGALALSACLAFTGAGGGLVISPNQTLTLAQVPREVAGVAGGVLQTGQRVGSAMGVAAATAAFFTVVTADGDYGSALSQGLRVSLGLVVVALVLAVVDLRRRAGDEGSGVDQPSGG